MRKIQASNKLIFSLVRKKSYYITTPIFYCNDKPHIGHFYTLSLADIFARWHRLNNCNVFFTVGTDNHGLKIQRAAETRGVSCEKLVNEMSGNFKNMFDKSDINYTDFIQTSDPDHKEKVHNVWRALVSKGFVVKSHYSGWYCIPDECFVTEKEMTLEMKQSLNYEWQSEENYIFDIEPFIEPILKWLDNKESIHPQSYVHAIKDIVRENNRISISRPKSRVNWGISVPDDPSQTIYVWFEALLNYLTVGEKNKVWPPDLQIIGKDILKFHTIIWPAILFALDLEPPKKILIHSHWLKDGVKMSKSLGNVVDYESEAAYLGGYEQLRYYLMSNDTIFSDSTYDRKLAAERVNADLVNNLANMLGRILSRKVNPDQIISGGFTQFDTQLVKGAPIDELLKSLACLPSEFQQHLTTEYAPHLSQRSIMNCITLANVFMNHQKPWSQPADPLKVNMTIHAVSETLRITLKLLQVFVPQLSERLYYHMNLPVTDLQCIQQLYFQMNPRLYSRVVENDKILVIPRIKV